MLINSYSTSDLDLVDIIETFNDYKWIFENREVIRLSATANFSSNN